MKKLAVLLLCGLLVACSSSIQTGDELIEAAQANSIKVDSELKKGTEVSFTPKMVQGQDGEIVLVYTKAKDLNAITFEPVILAIVSTSKAEAAKIDGNIRLKCETGEVKTDGLISIRLNKCLIM